MRYSWRLLTLLLRLNFFLLWGEGKKMKILKAWQPGQCPRHVLPGRKPPPPCLLFSQNDSLQWHGQKRRSRGVARAGQFPPQKECGN